MANGLFGGGSGSQVDPYIIEDLKDLNAIRNSVTSYYRLKNDIDASAAALSAVNLNSDGAGWNPIDIVSAGGGLDFNFYKIKNLFIKRPTMTYVGLFARFYAAFTIVRPHLENVDITGGSYVGGLVGEMNGSFINGGYVSGSLKGLNYVGGIVGAGRITSQEIKNVKCDVSLEGVSYVGGIVGGIATTRYCVVTGQILGADYVGGINGYAGASGAIEKCYNVGANIIRRYGSALNFGRITGSTTSVTITNCKSLETVKYLV